MIYCEQEKTCYLWEQKKTIKKTDVDHTRNGSRSIDANRKSSLNYPQPYIVDLLPRSNNAVQPGETITLVFNVTSLQTIPAQITFTCQTTQQQYFQQIIVRPLGSTIQPGTSVEASVTATVHRNVPQGTTILIEFLVRSYWEPQPVAGRAVYIYVGAQQNEDRDHPSFNYYIRSNCKDLPTDSCSLAIWSLEGTIQDSNSEDQQLSDAEIGLIVLGVILILILIILIVLAICLCRKSRSHDLRH
ncbi:hypothetical protein C0J52_07974 [Blattella germanica]|nr:hypothetical protein C0J52_07974 [Blattella germanica]